MSTQNPISRLKALLPTDFKRSLSRLLFVTILRKQPVHFIHVSKTGGTALQIALYKHAVTKRYALELHTHSTKLRDIPVGEKVIFFLRDPVTRYVSGFYTRWRHGRDNSPWTPKEEKAFKQFDTPNKLALALSSEDPEEKQSAIQAMRGIGHINTPIVKWFESQEYFLSRLDDIFFFGFQETLNEDFERLKAKLGTPKKVQLPSDDRNAHRTPDGFDKKLHEKAVENIKAWYAKDYEFIALCRQVVDRVNPPATMND